MTRPRRALLATALGLAALPVSAAEWTVRPGDDLQAALAAAAPGDVVRVGAGRYAGPFTVDRPLQLIGEGAVLDGGGQGTVVQVTAPDVLITGFEIRASGRSLDEENSGVAVEAPGATIADNQFADVLFGIYLRKAHGSRVLRNEIHGMDLDLARRGDAIRVWYSNDTTLEENRVRGARDVVLWYSERLTITGNRIEDGRYGLHFMYCDDARISRNLLLDNSVGAFLMYSRRLRLHDNTIAGNHGPSGYGVGLKDMDDAVVAGNRFVGNRVGAFLDNSPREIQSTSRIENNLFAGNDYGVRLLPNVRRADFSDNAFVDNREQVAVAGGGGDPTANRWYANHWSDYRGYDADRDGRGDVPYRADRLFESLVDRRPQLALFSHSPVSRAVDFAARAFPLVRPQPKLVDDSPRMAAMLPAAAPALDPAEGEGLARVAGLLALLSLSLAGAPRWLYSRSGRGTATLAAELPPEGETETSQSSRPPLSAVDAPALIEVEGLGKRFGDVVALEGVSFQVQPGEAVALWGSNGAGKTTALRCLLGVTPFEGRVRIAGFDVRSAGKSARRQLGFVPQESSFPDLTAGDTLELFARLHRADPERIPELVTRLGLDDELDKEVGSLSGGRKQRLALAVALLSDPPLLLLDEPTANLDVQARAEFLGLLAQLKGQGKTIVFSSHRPDEVRTLADRVLHLEAGRLRASSEAGAVDDGRDRVELILRLDPGQIETAAALLRARGLQPHRRAARLHLHVARLDKMMPIQILFTAGVEVLDFDLEALS